MKILKFKKLIRLIPLALVLVAILLAPTSAAFAAEPDGSWCSGMWFLGGCAFWNAILLGIPYLIGYLGGVLLKLSAYLTDFSFSLNTNIMEDSSHIMQNGFQICLSLANMIFVISLIIISFCTILNVEEYSAKKMLGKLISAAVLINFSYLIAGLFLDFSHVVTNFFLSGGDSLATSIGNAFEPQRFLIPTGAIGGIPFVSPEWYSGAISSILMVVFTWIMFLAMLSVALMFIARYIYLVVLIILMPLAWSLPLFPKMEEHGRKWWDKFIKQVLYLPAASFFLYLAIQSADALKAAISEKKSTFLGAESLGGWLESMGNLPDLVVKLLMVIGMIVAGLIVAGEMGGAGASFGSKLAEKIKETGKEYAKGAGRKMATTRFGKGKYKLSAEQAFKGAAKYTGKTLAGQTGVGRFIANRSLGKLGLNVATLGARDQVAGLMMNSGENFEGSIKAAKESFEKQLNRSQQNQIYHGKIPSNDIDAMAAMQAAIDHDKPEHLDTWVKQDPARMQEIIRRMDPSAVDHDGNFDPTESKILMAAAKYQPGKASGLIGTKENGLQDPEAARKKVHSKMEDKDYQKMDKKEINKENVAAANANGIAAMGRKNGERETLTIEALNSLKEEIRIGARKGEEGAVNIASAIKKNTEEAKEKRTKLAELIASKAAGESVDSEIVKTRTELSGLRKDKSELESALKDISPIMSKVLTAEDRLRNNPGSIANQEAGAKAAPAAHAAPAADHGGGGGHGGGHDAGH